MTLLVALPLGWGLRQLRMGPKYPSPEEVLFHLSVPPGFEAGLFAAEPMVVNPVCFCIDEQNRFYVVETQTFVYQPAYPNEQLACRTFEQSEAIRQRDLAKNPHPTGKSERVRLLEDRSGQGRCDSAETFADGFDLSDGVAAGVLARGGQVWLANIPRLWHFETSNGRAVKREVLHSGYGVRRANMGHDLHGLIFGPDGKLYFSIGDRGLHVRTREGNLIDLPDTGAVLRCNPDGSALEVFATGLRNPQKLAFDRFGNLFTCDNDANLGDMTRWLYLAEGSDAGWRIGFQMLPDAGPWNAERLWDPAGHPPPYCLPSLGRLGHGPAGLAYYPGTGLPAEYDDHFFLCDFPGNVLSFTVRSRGAGFELADVRNFAGPLWPTDLAFGLDGALYVSDWVFAFPMPQRGRIYRIRHTAASADPGVVEARRLLGEGMKHRTDGELVQLLGHRDQRVRQAAQFALADRNAAAIAPLTGAIASSQPLMRRVHAIWALGQIGGVSPQALPSVLPLLLDANDEVRAQAARIVGDCRCPDAHEGLIHLLQDPNLRVRYFAAMSLGKLGHREDVESILAMLRDLGDRDAFLRHGGVVALAGIGEIAALERAGRDPAVAVRLAALLALRKREHPAIAAFLHDPDPALVLEAARAIYDLPIADALPALAALADPPRFPAAAAERVINANFRLNNPGPLARLAATAEAPEAVRLSALKALSEWDQCTGKDRVLGLWRPLPERDRRAAADCLRPALPALLIAQNGEVAAAAARAAAALGIREVAGELAACVQNDQVAPRLRVEALRALAGLADARLGTAVLAALASSDESLRGAAVRLIPQARLTDAATQLRRYSGAEASIPIRQSAIAALGDWKDACADDVLTTLLEQALAGTLPAALSLDLLEAAGKRSNRVVIERAARLDAARPRGDPLAPWLEALEGGDAALGRQVFFENTSVACIRCHKVGAVGGDVGPPLSSVGLKHPRRYLLESIVFPNAAITPGYSQTTLRLLDGRVVAGRIEEETADRLALLLPDGQRRRIPLAEVETRETMGSAMPEGLAKLLTKRQLRDLVEYLTGLRAPPAAGSQF